MCSKQRGYPFYNNWRFKVCVYGDRRKRSADDHPADEHEPNVGWTLNKRIPGIDIANRAHLVIWNSVDFSCRKLR